MGEETPTCFLNKASPGKSEVCVLLCFWAKALVRVVETSSIYQARTVHASSSKHLTRADLILITRWACHYPHFTVEKTEGSKKSTLREISFKLYCFFES